LGLEAYNNRLLQLMRKGTDTGVIDRVLSNLSWAGLPASAYMIVGFPTETEREALDSFEKLREMRRSGLIVDHHYNPFQIAPHSPVAMQPHAYGIERISTLPGMDLDPPVYRFEGTGMPRERVYQLGIFESPMIASLLPRNANGGSPLREVKFMGKKISLRDDLYGICSLLRSTWQNTAWESIASFGQWIAKNEHISWPLEYSRSAAHLAASDDDSGGASL
jgi:radical SAM superfamily enzyme YgiQ (UPF0313 family)